MSGRVGSRGQRRTSPAIGGLEGSRPANGRRRISPAIGGLEGAADSGELLPRSAGWRARGQRTDGGGYLPRSAGWKEPRTAANFSRDRRAGGLAASGLAAIPPNSHADLTRARAEGRVATSLPRDRQNRNKKDFSKNEQNKTR